MASLLVNMDNSAHICSKMIRNAIRETKLGIPIVARAAGMGSVYAVDLNFALGSFLVAANEGSTFGYGSCWFDECWHWESIYDHDFGEPVGDATVSADYMQFRRQWTGVAVEVDCAIGSATLNFTKSFEPLVV